MVPFSISKDSGIFSGLCMSSLPLIGLLWLRYIQIIEVHLSISKALIQLHLQSSFAMEVTYSQVLEMRLWISYRSVWDNHSIYNNCQNVNQDFREFAYNAHLQWTKRRKLLALDTLIQPWLSQRKKSLFNMTERLLLHFSSKMLQWNRWKNRKVLKQLMHEFTSLG